MLQTVELGDDAIVTDFSFLFPSPSPLPNVQDITSKPPMRPSNLPPLIILDDHSLNSTHQNSSAQDYPRHPGLPGSPSTLSPHCHIYSASSNSDSDMLNPPSSNISSGTSSAMVSESEPPSAVASDSDLLLLPIPKLFKPKKQTGLHQFFPTLSEDEVLAIQAKRKRVDSEEEEADRAERRKKEEKQKQEKLISRRDNNRVAQQKYRKKLTAVDIQRGVRDSNGKLIHVS
jgi:hypothetical protein